MNLKRANLNILLMAASVFCLASQSFALADDSVEVDLETLHALPQASNSDQYPRIKLKKPSQGIEDNLKFDSGLFKKQTTQNPNFKASLTQGAQTYSPVELQNIEPAAGTSTVKARNLIPLPNKKPVQLVAASAPIPQRPPKRPQTSLKKAVLSTIGVKPEDPRRNTPPVPVPKVDRQALQPIAVKPETRRTEPPQQKETQRSNEQIIAGAVQRIFLSYPQNRTDVPENIEAALSPDILAEIQMQTDKRIRIYAFATSAENSESEARRTALARALELRQFLIAKDIPSQRIDLHPMGLKDDPLKKDRIEIILEDPS